MKTVLTFIISLTIHTLILNFSMAQNLTRVLLISSPELKNDSDQEAFERIFTSESPSSSKLHLYRADRGARNGDYLLAWLTDDYAELQSLFSGSHPFSDKMISKMTSTKTKPSRYISSHGKWTCYELIGGDQVGDLPKTEILGIHYIQIKPDKKEAFEKFIVKKLHKALSIPGMRLLYYKGIDGEEEGSYITIYAIESYDARERYWPTGAPETQELKDLFKPYKSLAQELKPYLVEMSFLKEDTGAGAAIFESLIWTDFKLVEH
jgi:hypothetical protein